MQQSVCSLKVAGAFARFRRAWRNVIIGGLLAIGVVVASPSPAAAQEIDVTPMAINVTVPYGTTVTRTLTIQNQGVAGLVWRDNKGEVVRNFSTPGPGQYKGIAFDGTYLRVIRYVYSPSASTLYLGKIDPANGAWLGEIEIKGWEGQYAKALDWDGQYLWFVEYYDQEVTAIDPVSGQVVKTLKLPPNGQYKWQPDSVTVGEGCLWVPGKPGTRLGKVNPSTGAIIGDLPYPFFSDSLEYFRGALWTEVNTNICKLDPGTGQKLDSFPSPAQVNTFVKSIQDMSEGGPGDEGRLWVLGTVSGDKIYLVETGEISWLRQAPRSGTVPGGSSQTVTLTLNSVAVGVGVHTATVTILSNDANEPRTQVPVTFTVTPVGQPPMISKAAWADPNPVPMLATTVHVVAAEPDGDPLTYRWSMVSGPRDSEVTFATATAADSGVTFSFKEGGRYVLRVTVSDNKGNSVSSDVEVRVALNIGADINHDGVVNALDAQIVIENLGKTTP